MSASTVVVGIDPRTSGGSVATGAFITHTLPADVQAGDILIVGMQLREASTTYSGWRVPAGWTAQTPLSSSGSGSYAIYTATYGTDVTGTSWTWDNGASNTTATRWSSCLVALAGSQVTGVAGHAAQSIASTASPSSPSLTTSGPAVLVGFAGSRTSGGVTFTAPGGWVEQSDVAESTATNAVTLEVSVDDTTPEAAGTYSYAPTSAPASSSGFASVTAFAFTTTASTAATASGSLTLGGIATPSGALATGAVTVNGAATAAAVARATGAVALGGIATPSGTTAATAAGGATLGGQATATVTITLPPLNSGGPRWAFAAGNWTGLPTTELPNLTSRSLKLRLAGTSEATVTVDGSTADAAAISELITDLWVMRAGVTLFRGRFGPSDDTLDGTKHTSSFTVGDYRSLLQRRILFDANQLIYTNVEQTALAASLLSTTQSQSGGDLNIVNGAVPTSVTRTITYPAGQSIGQAIEQLSLMDAGFNWDIVPATGKVTQTFTAWASRGESKQRVLSYPGSLATVRRAMDPSGYANALRETGNTDVAAVRLEASDIGSRPEGRWDRQSGDTTLLNAASVTARANYDLAASQRITPTYTVQLRPGEWGGPVDIWLGDVVLLSITSGRLAVQGEPLRVWEIDIDLDDADNETVTLTLAALDPTKQKRARRYDQRLTALERR